MGLHIELSGHLEPRELDAVAALIAVLRGADPVPVAAPLAPPAAALAAPVSAPPAPAPTAPSATTLPTTAANDPAEQLLQAAALAQANGVVVDANGIPWDARIHGSTKALNEDKTWRKKRGVEASLVEAVTAELRGIMSAPQRMAEAQAEVERADVMDPAAAFGGPAPAPAPVPAPPAPVPAPPPAPAPDASNDFARVMKVVLAKQAAGTITTELVTTIAQQVGLTSVRDLASRPDLIPVFEAMLP